ncbi:MAG: 2-oxo acid dehydrogenase subunit E2 [Bacteroidales bacterium]|nr:2-oxo acid dehydrogenase subunit E2 [Bacteroidales bacterium]
MATPIMMPKQGQSVESCILTEWHKQKGEYVNKGEILFTYETDKASFEYEAEAEGTLLEMFFEEGDEVPVLTNIAVIGEQGEAVDEFNPHVGVQSGKKQTEASTPEEDKQEKAKETPSYETTATPETEKQKIQGKTAISPRAKKLAEQHKVLYKNLKGSGPNGRIIERDIQQAIQAGQKATSLAYKMSEESGAVAPSEGTGVGSRVTDKDLTDRIYQEDYEVKKLSNVRKIIASSMHASLQNAAQLTHHTSADARNILQLRKTVKAEKEKGMISNITLNDMVCSAVIKALKKHPDANAHFGQDHIKIFNKVHLGFAVDTNRGLMVPVVRNADDLTLESLSNQMKALSDQCKQGDIDPELIASEAASFTVSNLGAYGVEMFTPILNLPQVGVLGVNAIVNRPADLGNGVFGFVPYIGLSLTYDHRAIDGGPASLFLKTIREEIEQFDINI